MLHTFLRTVSLLVAGPQTWHAALMAASAQTSLTIYNQDFAVVRGGIPLDLEAGENVVETTGITAMLEPDSVILRLPEGAARVRILEQNYRNDPASQDLLLRHFEGEEIEFERQRDGEIERVRGRIVRAPERILPTGNRPTYQAMQSSNAPLIEVDGRLRFSLPGLPLFPALGDDSILRPTLTWRLEADDAFDGIAELGYISAGFSWKADYNLVLPAQDTGASALTGWITMTNESGRTFDAAEVSLMAGDVSKIEPEQPAGHMARSMVLQEADGAGVTQQSFDEFHLYSLERPVTLRDRQTKQVEFLRSGRVAVRREYVYNGLGHTPDWILRVDPESLRTDRAFGTQSNTKVWVYQSFENTEANGLGVPLPAGRLRFYREGENGRLEFTGENTIDHTPREEEVRVYTGDAFDLVGDRRQTDFRLDSGRRILTESFEIELRNRKETDVTIRVVELLYRGYQWKITSLTLDGEKVEPVRDDSRTIHVNVPMAPNAEREIRYTVEYTW